MGYMMKGYIAAGVKVGAMGFVTKHQALWQSTIPLHRTTACAMSALSVMRL